MEEFIRRLMALAKARGRTTMVAMTSIHSDYIVTVEIEGKGYTVTVDSVRAHSNPSHMVADVFKYVEEVHLSVSRETGGGAKQ